MALCEVHELDGEPAADDRYCVKCGTPEFAILALVTTEARLDGLVNKFGEDGQAYQGPQYWQDRVDSMERSLADAKQWVDIYRMLRNAHKHFRRILLKRVADLEEDCEPFRSQIDQRKTYKVNTPSKAASDLFDAVKGEW